MRTRLILILVTFLVCNSYNSQSFKKLYKESLKYLEVNDYENALPLLMKMYDLKPNNANTNFSIGNCLMNIIHREKEAIPYYEKAMEGLTIGYRIGNHREKKAPLATIELLGRSYHHNYEFDKAIDKFEFYSNFLAENNWDDKRANNRRIRQAKYAKSLFENPVEVDIIPIKHINTDYAEYRPKLNAEENIMYFTSKRPGGSSDILDDQGEYYEDIYISKKKMGVWTEPQLVNDLINTTESSSCLYLSPDGEHMFLSMVNNDQKLGPLGRGIYEARLDGNHWNNPEFLDQKVNSKYWETYASLDIYGNVLFFVSDREGGYGGRDIWMMKKLPSGEWAEPQNLGEPINTEYDEESPYLHPDGKTLYFSSKGHKVMGGFDIFKSTLKDDYTWTSPENMGYPVNTVDDDLFFTPTVNGKRAYFSSFRDEGTGDYDIFRINLINEEEKDLAAYKGVVKDSVDNVVKDLIISVYDENEERYGVYRPNQLTGNFLFILRPGHQYEIMYELNDFSAIDTLDVPLDVEGVIEYTKVVRVNSDGLTISKGVVVDGDILALAELDDPTNIDLSDVHKFKPSHDEIDTGFEENVEEETKPKQEVIEEKQKDRHVLFHKNIYFKLESADLSDASKEVLDELIVELKANPDWHVNSVGHTDNTGSVKYNNLLSVLRAEAVKTYLYNRGVEFKRLHAYGMGAEQPVAENLAADGSDNPTGRAANRRVEIQLVK